MQKEINEQQLRDQMEENFERGLELYRGGNYHKGIECFQKALGTCEICNCDHLQRVKILFYLGHAYQLRNSMHDSQIAEDYYQELLTMEDLPLERYYQIQYSRGNLLTGNGQFDKSLELFSQLQDEENPFLKDVWVSQSYAYFLLGKYEDASYYSQSVMYCEKIIQTANPEKERKNLYYAYHNLGHIFYEMGENVKSMMNFQASVELSDNDVKKYEAYVDMGLVLVRLSQYDLAWAYIDKAQKYFEKTKSVVHLAGCLFAKGMYYKQKGKIQEATYYFELALSGYREKEHYYGVVKTYFELYDLYSRFDTEKADLYYDQHKFYMNYINSPGIERSGYMMDEESLWN